MGWAGYATITNDRGEVIYRGSVEYWDRVYYIDLDDLSSLTEGNEEQRGLFKYWQYYGVEYNIKWDDPDIFTRNINKLTIVEVSFVRPYTEFAHYSIGLR